MPDTFDPDAWPGGNTGSTPNNGSGGFDSDPFGASAHSGDDDDFGAYGFNEEPGAAEDPDDDFGSFSYDFDDDPAPASQQRSSSVATSKRGTNDDFYGSDDDDDIYANPYGAQDNDDEDEFDRFRQTSYDDDDDDDFDRFDDFDDSKSGDDGNLKRKLIGVGAIAAFVFAIGLGVMALVNGGDSKTKDSATPEATTAPTPPPTAAPNAAAAPADDQGPPQADPNANIPPAEVTHRLSEALQGWGQFAVDGDLSHLGDYFVPTSSQYLHLKNVESPALRARPVTGPPFTMTMSREDLKWVKSDNNWKISGTVIARRDGDGDQQFRWEFTMTQVTPSSPWQISQVRQF